MEPDFGKMCLFSVRFAGTQFGRYLEMFAESGSVFGFNGPAQYAHLARETFNAGVRFAQDVGLPAFFEELRPPGVREPVVEVLEES